jgi:hypothetical protein
MLGRSLLIAAGVLYAITLGFVLWPTHAQSESIDAIQAAAPMVKPASKSGLPFRAVGMQIQRVDWIDKYEQSIDEIAADGADAVLLVVDSRQENGTSSHIYLDMRMTPTPEKLSELIGHAKKRGLRVILMPIVLLDNPKGNEWRGTLKPDSWDDWFDSYRDMITQFAWIAEGNGVDLLVVGSELVSAEPHVEQWDKTIEAVRKIYHGKLTYSSNWDHYTAVSFWNKLDMIGMNSYWKLGKDHTASIAEIESHWHAIQKDVLDFQRKMSKPIMFLEVGWCSLANAAHEPWDYTQTSEDVDLDLQRRLYEGFFRSWYGNPALGGFSIWEWPPIDGGKDDRGYTPKNKPAEKVLKAWLKKPVWKVN